MQAEVKSWYVNFNQYKKQALLAKLKAVFEGTPLPTVDNGGHGVGEVPQQQQRQVVGLESEAVKVIQDLTFNDIPRGGEYTAAIQSLLVMVLRQEERIQQLEAVISQLVAVPAE